MRMDILSQTPVPSQLQSTDVQMLLPVDAQSRKGGNTAECTPVYLCLSGLQLVF